MSKVNLIELTINQMAEIKKQHKPTNGIYALEVLEIDGNLITLGLNNGSVFDAPVTDAKKLPFTQESISKQPTFLLFKEDGTIVTEGVSQPVKEKKTKGTSQGCFAKTQLMKN